MRMKESEVCWKLIGTASRGTVIHCREYRGHPGDCKGAMEYKMPPDAFGPINCDWSEKSTAIWRKIWEAVQDGTELTLSEGEIDRLGGMLWNLGVLK